LILALIFVYPILLISVASDPDSPRLQWALFGFSALAGLVLTCLVPAAHGGRTYVAENGSPWRWPLFPWSLFLIMAGGLAVRSYSLCVSFHYVGGTRTIFAPYFLVPIGLAVSLVWLEIGIVSERRGVMFLASALPLVLVGVAMNGHRFEPVYERFLGMFMDRLGGSPAFLTLIAAALVQSYAAARKTPLALELLCASVLGLAFVGPQTVALHELDRFRLVPWLGAGVLLGLIAWRRHSPFRAVMAAFVLIIGTTFVCARIWPAAPQASIAVHLGMLSLMVLGASFGDWLRDLAQALCPLALAVPGVAAVLRLPWIEPLVPLSIAAWYPLFVIVAGASYGYLTWQPRFTLSALATLTYWLFESGSLAYQQARRLLTGLDALSAGIVLFIVALAISLRKAGLMPRIDVEPQIRRLLVAMRLVRAESFWEADEWEGSEGTVPEITPDGEAGAQVRQ
jgi:hypothetical protein